MVVATNVSVLFGVVLALVTQVYFYVVPEDFLLLLVPEEVLDGPFDASHHHSFVAFLVDIGDLFVIEGDQFEYNLFVAVLRLQPL